MPIRLLSWIFCPVSALLLLIHDLLRSHRALRTKAEVCFIRVSSCVWQVQSHVSSCWSQYQVPHASCEDIFACPWLVVRSDTLRPKLLPQWRKCCLSSPASQNKMKLMDPFFPILSLAHASAWEFSLICLTSLWILYYSIHIVWISRCAMDERVFLTL